MNRRELRLTQSFTALLVGRLLYPFFNSPLTHLASDPLRHWQTGLDFLHPDVMGGGDPFFYQLWLYGVRSLAGTSEPFVLFMCGVLCAAMPYGWYRALRELLPREESSWGAIAIGLTPGFLGIYGYFMTETLLLSLTGCAFWFTLRAARKKTLGAFSAAASFWIAASFTRIVVLPMAALCLGWLWLATPRKPSKLAALALVAAVFAIPAGLHARAALGYFAPLGNLYLNEIYHASGRKDIDIDYGPKGRYVFGSPSYYNPTFYPFSMWTTARTGTAAIFIDTRRGRADWISEGQRMRLQPQVSVIEDRWENVLYLLFAQQWPDNDTRTVVGWLSVWSRWLWLPLVVAVMLSVIRRRFNGAQWLLPVCALSMFALLALQSEGIMEGRFRKPIEPIFLASLVVAVARKTIRRASP